MDSLELFAGNDPIFEFRPMFFWFPVVRIVVGVYVETTVIVIVVPTVDRRKLVAQLPNGLASTLRLQHSCRR